MQTSIKEVDKAETELTKQHLRIASDASLYTIATTASSVITFLSGLVIKRYLGPTDFGVWTLAYIVLTYLNLLDFGTIAAANKEIPYELGKEDERTAEIIKGTLLTFIGLTAVIAMIFMLIYVFTGPSSMDLKSKYAMTCIAICLPLFQIHQALTTILWINKKFREASLLVLIEAASNCLIGMLLVYLYGLYGMYASFIITLLLKAGYLLTCARHNARLKLDFSWDLVSFKRLISKGIPLQIAGCVNLLKVSLATLLIGKFINITAVGYYAFAVSIQNFILLGPNAFWIIMFPRFQERFAAHNDDVSVLQSYFIKPLTGFTFFLLPLLISFSYFIIPIIIKYILPTFIETIAVLKIMLIGTFFFSMECIPGQIMVTTNNLWTRSILGIMNVFIIITCILVSIYNSNTLINFTIAIALGNILGFVVNYVASYILLNKKSSILKLLLKIILAFAYLFFIMYIIDTVIAFKFVSFVSKVGESLFKWILSLITLMPLFIIAERNLSLLSTLRHLMSSRLGRKVCKSDACI